MLVSAIGIDLAKNVFQLHGADDVGRPVLRKQLRREQMMSFFVQVPACLIGMEACASAHHWARKLQGLGHTVQLIAPQFVKPYVKSNKNDAADAEAICEAVRRPTMRFVPIKNIEQQAALALHRVRQSLVKSRTAQANQIRGLLAEYGLVMPPRISSIRSTVPKLLDEATGWLPAIFRELILELLDYLTSLDQRVKALERQVQAWHRENSFSMKLAQIPGVGALTASALVASIGDAKQFCNGRQLAAWLGLVPRQYSTGGKPRLLGISKRGDSYLRTLLIHGARSALRTAHRKSIGERWLNDLVQRRHPNIAAVALANKNARIAWALLAQNRIYDDNFERPLQAA
jgi:transposase